MGSARRKEWKIHHSEQQQRDYRQERENREFREARQDRCRNDSDGNDHRIPFAVDS